jgi:hypothetical protein
MKLVNQILRVEVENLTPRSLLDRNTTQTIASARATGSLYVHRRHFLVGDIPDGYLIRVVPIGEEADTVTYGEMDFRISMTPPEVYFKDYVEQFLAEANAHSGGLTTATIYVVKMDADAPEGGIVTIRKIDLGNTIPERLDL